MSKRVKDLMISELQGGLEKQDSCVVVGVGPLDVLATTELRTDLREKGVRFHVLKNRLAVHAFKGVGWEGLEKSLSGTSAVAYGEGGAMAASKILLGWEKKSKGKISIRGGVLDGRIMDEAEVRQLATIPERPVLLSMIASVVAAPITQVACLVSEMLAGVARAVGAVATKLETTE